MTQREYRGKRTDNGEWVYGNLVRMNSAQKYGDSTVFSNFWIVEINEELYTRAFSDGNAVWADNEFIQVDPDTVGQYTGIQDKNGVYIYDGDLIRVWLVGDEVEDFVVTWSQEDARFTLLDAHGVKWGFTEANEFAVIGNIHDHPHLLNKEVAEQ